MNFKKIQSLVETVTRHNDISLAILIVAIIALMILPMPTPVVDALIAANLTIAVTLLMLSIYIPSALSLSSFPTLLLFTTLFRLSLNITTTRSILLYAFGGSIIDTFGNFVVAGNFVVGGVIFLIITIVQFLVIAKGAERVAEVGARFTLDAMPGKQMSIDADLRAGVIEMEEAQQRRSDVEKESQLYGAMDGAMKFVKGDAVAGLIVTAINIIGGLTIGVTQKGMSAGEAVQTYSILTIGDGLVSQIPALFISITAAVITTRVSSTGNNLGDDIGVQVLGQPKALLVSGCITVAFGMIPGFPKVPFMVLGLGMAGIGYTLRQAAKMPEESPQPDYVAAMTADGQKAAPVRQDGEEFSVTVPLMIDVDARVQDSIDPQILNDELIRIRRALYLDLGVPFPGINLRFNENLQNGSYMIMLQEIPVSQGILRPGSVLVRDNQQNLDIMSVPYQNGDQFLPDIPTLWVEDSHREQLLSASIPFLDPPQILTYHLSFILKKHADDFVGIQEVKFLLDRMEETHGELVREVQRVLPVQKIAEVFQRMV
jgi:type III secretion protein V